MHVVLQPTEEFSLVGCILSQIAFVLQYSYMKITPTFPAEISGLQILFTQADFTFQEFHEKSEQRCDPLDKGFEF